MASPRLDKRIKVVLIGDNDVGRPQILDRMIGNPFKESYSVNLDADFKIRKEDNITVQIWNQKLGERFRTITDGLYLGTDVAVIVFDITNRKSYDHVETWMAEVARYHSEDAKIILVANKCDLVTKAVVSPDEAAYFAAKHKIPLFEISAKTGTNIELLFRECLKLATLSAGPAKPEEKPLTQEEVIKLVWNTLDINKRNTYVIDWLARDNNLSDDEWKLIRRESLKILLETVKTKASAKEKTELLTFALKWPLFAIHRKVGFGDTDAVKAIKSKILEYKLDTDTENAKAKSGVAGFSMYPAAAAPAAPPAAEAKVARAKKVP